MSDFPDDDRTDDHAAVPPSTQTLRLARAPGPPMRLDQALAAALPALSRTRIKTLVLEGRVRVGGRTIEEPSSRVNEGAEIEIDLPAPEPAAPRPQPIPLDIVYEDSEVIVVDKPAGLVVHPAAGNPDGTLVNALLAHCGASLSGIGGVIRPGIVHRLDKDTSGLMVVAKNDRAHRLLARQFEERGRGGPLERSYLAIVWGAPRSRGTVDASLARDPANRRKVAVRPDGKHAVTHYEVVERFGPPEDPVATLVRCRLETGRTHQIRVHMAHIGHPLIGDAEYGAHLRSKARRLPEPAAGLAEAFPRQALHAQTLGFRHPGTGAAMRFESPLPADFSELLAALRVVAKAGR